MAWHPAFHLIRAVFFQFLASALQHVSYPEKKVKRGVNQQHSARDLPSRCLFAGLPDTFAATDLVVILTVACF